MADPAVIVEKDGHVLTVTLNRPEKRNAVNCEVMCRLYDAWQQLVRPYPMPPPARMARPVGCRHCRDTGYVGRQGIYEVLVNTPAVQALITAQIDTARIREAAMREGMHTLRLSGAGRVARGETTIEEVMRVAPALDS